MTSSQRLSMIESIYNKRAPSYDSEDSFHPTQAADYLKWMNLSPGLKVLDLACGTGAIAIPAGRAVGPSGQVIGVDISGDSIAIARAKAERENINVRFIQYDVGALHELKELEEGAFDVITCASAFVLIEAPAAMVKRCAILLKMGGKMIFDVPTKDGMVAGYVLDIVGKKLRVPMTYNRTGMDSIVKIKELLTDAGLDASESFISESYKEAELAIENSEEIFNATIGHEWFEGAYAGFNDPVVKETARNMFSKELKNFADSDGKIKETWTFTMAVGKRI